MYPAYSFAQQNAQVIASKGGHRLTEDDVNISVRTLEFIVGQKLKPAEIGELRTELMTEFERDPKTTTAQIKQVGDMMNQLYKRTDPIQIAEGRLVLLGEFHKAAQATPQKDWPASIKIQNRYVTVLQYDPQTGLLLTNKDIESFLNFVDFARKVGGEGPLPVRDKNEFRTSLPQMYPQLNQDQKAIFAVMPIVWEVIDAQWKSLTPAQQKQALAQMRAESAKNSAPQQAARPAVRQPSNARSSAALQQELQRQQRSYEIMMRASQIGHVTSMNILEAAAGSNNY